MLVVGDLIRSVRYLLRDMQGAMLSDYELIEAINRGAALLFARMAENSVQAAVKRVKITVPAAGFTSLPPDFHNVRWVAISGSARKCVPTQTPEVRAGEYRIAGERFEAPSGVYEVEYYGLPARVSGYDEELSVPNAARRFLEDVVAAMARDDVDHAEQAALLCCRELAGGELTRLADTGPVKVWGGRA